MSLRVGRVLLSDPGPVAPYRRRTIDDGYGPTGDAMPGDVARSNPGYRISAIEKGASAKDVAKSLLDEWGRMGSVYVVQDDDLLPAGYYEMQDLDQEMPKGGPAQRPSSFVLVQSGLPFVVRQAEDDNIRGTDAADANASERLKVAYTPSTTERVVLVHGHDLLAAWRLEADGADSSGLGHAMTMNGSPAFAAAKLGNGLNADGVDDYGTMTAPSGVGIAEGYVRAWFSLASVGADLRAILALNNGTPNRLVLYAADTSGRLSAQFGDGAAVTTLTGTTYSLATLHHALLTWKATGSDAGAYLYLDGVLVASSAIVPNVTSGASWFLGSFSATQRFHSGLLDEVRVGRRHLSAKEVLADYNATKGGTRPTRDQAPAKELLNLPAGSYKVVARARGVTTATAKLRATLRDGDGATLAAGSQVTVTPADAWVDLSLGTFAVPDANDGDNWLEVAVQDPTNTNPVWVDRIFIVPA